MPKIPQYLEDEHMRLYEWSGAGVPPARVPPRSKRTHSWHASYGVLALLTSLLALNACDNKGPVGQGSPSFQGPRGGPEAEAGRILDAARERAGQTMGRIGEDTPKP
jgi:hypothetical protein